MRVKITSRPPPSIRPSPAPSAPSPAENVRLPASGAVAAGVSPASSAPALAPGDAVRAFYDAFERKDVAAMGRLYADDVKFRDAIFSFHDKSGVTRMWTKLFATDPRTTLKFTLDQVKGDVVTGHWVADYHLGTRAVQNEVTTTMRVHNGKIVEHTDDFSWDRWAPQAIPGGKLFTLPGFDALAKGLIRFALS